MNRHHLSGLTICTDYWAKPIPPRQFDWSAWRDGDEESGPTGHGRTEQDAIENLLAQLDDLGP